MFPLTPLSRQRSARRLNVGTSTSSWATFSPLALRPLLWLDASDTSSITSSLGKVSQWNDKSGNANHATQANSTYQPTTGSATKNGLNVLTFGVHGLATPTITYSFNRFTCFAVCRAETSVEANRQVVACAVNGGTILWLNSGKWSLYASLTFSSATNYDTNWHVFTGVFSGSESAIRLDGTQLGNTGNSGSATFGVALGIGGRPDNSSWWVGDIAEVVLCPRALSGNELRTVENYLSSKWAIY